VADAAELRIVITNKLLDLSMCGDPRIEIKATEMLGKISDVGLFTEKTEITVNYNNVADLDKAIKDKVRKMLMIHGADLSPVDIDVDAELGTSLPLVEEAPPAEELPPEAPDEA
jgi:PHP family Zn ribbon phosphoesterase